MINLEELKREREKINNQILNQEKKVERETEFSAMLQELKQLIERSHKEYLDKGELCEYLSIKECTYYKYKMGERIPHMQIGSIRIFKKTAVDTYVLEATQAGKDTS